MWTRLLRPLVGAVIVGSLTLCQASVLVVSGRKFCRATRRSPMFWLILLESSAEGYGLPAPPATWRRMVPPRRKGTGLANRVSEPMNNVVSPVPKR